MRLIELTPPGRGAISVLLLEGEGAREAVQSRFRGVTEGSLGLGTPDRPLVGHFDLGGGVHEEVVLRPRSDQSVEIHCHGGRAVVARLVCVLASCGAEVADWSDWVGQGSADPIAAAAHHMLALARTERTAAILLDQYNGALRRRLEAVVEDLRAGQPDQARQRLSEVRDWAPLGQHLVQPWRVVLAGEPNVGKSSLVNAIVGYRRAIVHPVAGTTRDVVSAITALDGWPVELCDTAGLRDAGPALERSGIELAQETMRTADLLVLVFDAGRPWSCADQQIRLRYPEALVVHNKADLCTVHDASRPAGVWTSALVRQGIEDLVRAIVARLVPAAPPPGAPVPFTGEQVGACIRAWDALAAGQVSAALDALTAVLQLTPAQ